MSAPAAKPAEQPTHTPGPWSVDDSDPDNLKVVCDFFEDETPGICGDHSTAWKLSPADARLIAAALDYQEAAQAFVKPYERLSEELLKEIASDKQGSLYTIKGTMTLTAHVARAILTFRAALAKARAAA